MTFLELLKCNDEFTFEYEKTKYEVICENGKRCIYEQRTNTLIGEYMSNDDLIKKAQINGKKVFEIIKEINII